MLAHVNNELYHLNDKNDVQDAELKLLLKSVGGRLNETLGKINYAGQCNIRKQKGLHLVVEGEVGPVTVLLMPGEDISQRISVADVRFKGVILPIPVGSAAILGEQGEPLEKFEQKLMNSVSWVST